jgi:hypothetical protein
MLRINKTWAVVLLFASLSAVAQSGTSSPYSIAGIGELKFGGFNQHKGTGTTSIAQRSKNTFSALNPASYANVGFTIFDVGASMSLGTLTVEGLDPSFTRAGNFNYFAMAFPIAAKKKMGVSFGINQFSDVGYTIRNNVADTPSYYNQYLGDGGLSRVYVGYGIEIIKNLNIGFNANYIFGNVASANTTIYPSSTTRFSFIDETYFAYGGASVDIGAQYTVQQFVRKEGKEQVRLNHTIAASYQGATQLIGDGYRFSQTVVGTRFALGEEVPIDTILFEDNKQDTTTKPIGFTLGYTLKYGDIWSLSLEAEQNLWSSVTDGRSGNKFFDNTRLAAGFSIIPLPKYGNKGSYLKKVEYRLGARHENLYYNFNGEQISEVGISIGLGLPIIKSVRIEEEKVAIVSRVNLSAEYVKRGSTSNGLIQEDYFNIGIGLNLNDKWFTKRKYR